MLDNVKRFDMKREPTRQHLRPLIKFLCTPTFKKHKGTIKRINMEGVDAPFLLLGNHNAYMDVEILNVVMNKYRVNYVIAIDGFIGREGILRYIGGICKRKFTNDPYLIKQLQTVIKRGDIPMIYPEARYSLCGTTAIIPDTLGRLVKFYNVPVVVLLCHGHHINSPFWNSSVDRKVQGIEAELTCIVTKEEVKTLSADEINRRIHDALQYDDFAWQKEQGIEVTYPKRAEGLHKVLYQCPHCGTEYEMTSFGTTLKCNHCQKEWEMTTLGELKAKDGETEFSHIPDWYEWERDNVRKEVENGTYRFESEVHIDALPNAKKFIHMGKGLLIHDMEGFTLKGNDKGEPFEVKIPSLKSYGVHIEYEYLFKYGDCVDLNTLNDTFYVYPECEKFSVTKISLATEEIYKYLLKKGK